MWPRHGVCSCITPKEATPMNRAIAIVLFGLFVPTMCCRAGESEDATDEDVASEESAAVPGCDVYIPKVREGDNHTVRARGSATCSTETDVQMKVCLQQWVSDAWVTLGGCFDHEVTLNENS